MISFFFLSNFVYVLGGLWLGSRLSHLSSVILLSGCLLISLSFYGSIFIGWLWVLVYVGGMLIIFTYCIFIMKPPMKELLSGFMENSALKRFLMLFLGMSILCVFSSSGISLHPGGDFIFRGLDYGMSPIVKFIGLSMILDLTSWFMLILFLFIIFILMLILFLLSSMCKTQYLLFDF